MKVSLSWLKELVDYQLSADGLAAKLSLNSIGVKQQTEDYLELDLTYNRGDLLSLRGVAYEVSAITDSPLMFLAQPVGDFIWAGQNLPKVKVSVEEDIKLSPVYCIAKIENLKVEQSNKTWVKKLSDSGIRPVNNITDITNLVMVEYGQPMHAFDMSKVKDETLVVRTAKKGERLITLDGKRRDLDPADLLIADSEKNLGLAGIMGGENCEISNSTTSILLEAAIFNPVLIRKTSNRHGLASEASKRFQHGLSSIRLLQALDAAIRMYQALGGKLTAINLVGEFNHNKRQVDLTISKVNGLLGLNLDKETVTAILKKLNFNVNSQDSDTLEVMPPYFRMDINIEEDAVEEVARMYGYEKIGGTPLADENIPDLDQSLPDFIYDLKLKCQGIGLTEVQTYSFYSVSVLKALEGPQFNKKDLVRVANPISSETEYLRVDLWPNLVETVGKNIKKGYKDIGIFEIGKVYRQENGQIMESFRLSVALMNNTEDPLAELFQLIQSLKLHLEGLPRKAGVNLKPAFFHPKRLINGMGEVHLKVLNKLGIEKRIAVLEIDLTSNL